MTSTPAAFGYQFLFIYIAAQGREIFALLGMTRDRDKLFEKTSPEVRALRKQATRELRKQARREWKEKHLKITPDEKAR